MARTLDQLHVCSVRGLAGLAGAALATQQMAADLSNHFRQIFTMMIKAKYVDVVTIIDRLT